MGSSVAARRQHGCLRAASAARQGEGRLVVGSLEKRNGGSGSCLLTGLCGHPLQSMELEGVRGPSAAAIPPCAGSLAAPHAYSHPRAKPEARVPGPGGRASPGQREHAAVCRAAVLARRAALSRYFCELSAIPTFSACFS